MIFCDNDILKIETDKKPCVCARTILPSMTEDEKRNIQRKPFMNKCDINFFITYKGEEYAIFIPKGYSYDGATIPFGCRWILGGKGNPKFLTASMLHDKMCECKWLVNYNRKLSSMVFREMLVACGCSKFKANIMFNAVEIFQKMVKGWKNGTKF